MFIGSWMFSGIILCFAIALVVMAFIPRPVEPKAAPESLTDEWRTPLSPTSILTGLPVLTYNNKGELPRSSLSPDHRTSPVDNIHRKITRGGTSSTASGPTRTRNAPGRSTSIGPVLPHADSFSQKFLSFSPTSRVPIRSRESMIRSAVGGENTPAVKVRPNLNFTFSKLPHNDSSPIPLRISPYLATMPYDRDTGYGYIPEVFSALSNDSDLASPWDDLQPTYPEDARTTTTSIYSSDSTVVDVHSIEVGPTPYALLPAVPTPRAVRFQDSSTFWGSGPIGISSQDNASFTAGGSIAPLIRSVSKPRRAVQHSGVGMAHHASMRPVVEAPFLRRGSDVEVLDKREWWRLVRNAATTP